jgi:PAP_fibrillin
MVAFISPIDRSRLLLTMRHPLRSLPFLLVTVSVVCWLPLTAVRSFELPSFTIFGSNKPKPQDQTVTDILFTKLRADIQKAPKNGINTPKVLELEILRVCEALRSSNPTPNPALNKQMMNGFWKMLWTNFSPASPSTGKLGPFIGTVYQDIDLDDSVARNIVKIDIPPIAGELVADVKVANSNTIAISFKTVGSKLGGILKVGPNIQFEAGQEVRLWEHLYLDRQYRIFYARRVEANDKGFLYVMERAEQDRFETNVNLKNRC